MLFKKKPKEVASNRIETTTNDAESVLDAFSRSQAVIEFTPSGDIITANENFLATLGYTLDEIQGKHHRMFVVRAEVATDEYEAFWRDLSEGRFIAGEFERINKNGESVWISASYNPVIDDDGKVTKVVKIAADITATKQVSIERLALLDAISNSQAMIEFTPSGDIITANENFLATLGYTLDEIQGKHHRIFCDKEYVATNEYADFWRQLANGTHFTDRFRRVAKDGRDVWIQASYNPVLDGEGKPFKIVKIAADITAEMTTELRNREQTAGVAHTVASSATEMTATIQEISSNVSRTSTLAGDSESAAKASLEAAERLKESSKEIGNVVGVIQDLADQTNLLALNATIEAARAGESGRGFAVVASEVKELARGTTDATQTIENSISRVQAQVDEFADKTKQINDSIAEVNANTLTVASAIEEQTATMAELSRTAEGLIVSMS